MPTSLLAGAEEAAGAAGAAGAAVAAGGGGGLESLLHITLTGHPHILLPTKACLAASA